MVALSTSSAMGSVALLENGATVVERVFPSGILHGQALVPSLQKLFAQQGWLPRGFDAVAVDVGPGSYTGCRVGLSAAKLLANDLSVPIVGISSLVAIAWQAVRQNENAQQKATTVAAVLDARRDRVYGALYAVAGTGVVPLRPPCIAQANAWVRDVTAEIWAGEALAHSPALAGLPERRRAPQETWLPRAGSIALLGRARLARGERDDPYRIEPLYLQPTEAEARFGEAKISREAPR